MVKASRRLGAGSGLEGLGLFPGFVNPRLNAGRIVGLIQHMGYSYGMIG
jgi:hypothetical protein